MSNDTETQTSQFSEEASSRGSSPSSPSSPSSTTAAAAQSHKQQQSKHKFRHEVKSKSSLPPIQECTLAECIAFLRLENSPTGSSPSSASVVSDDASASASATQEEPVSNECSSIPGTGGTDSGASSSSALDCFLTEALKNHQHRLFILKLERDFSQFLDQARLESMELPWINSFYRMMIHKVANCFLLERRIDTTQKTITLYRTDQSALPAFRFEDLMQQEEVEEEEAVPAPAPTPATKPIKVLKRCPPRPATVCGERSCSSSARVEDSRRSTASIKEREEAYAKARARIFQGTDETGHSRSLSSSSSSSNTPRTQSRSNREELAEESNMDEMSTIVGSDNDFITSPTSPCPSTTYNGHDGSFLHQRGRSSESSELGYPSPQHQYSGQFYRDPSRRTSAPSLGAHGTYRQVVPGARHFVQGSDGVIRYDPAVDTSPQKPPPQHHSSGGPGKRQSYPHQGEDQYTHSRETQCSHPPQHRHSPHHLHHTGHYHEQACSLVRQHSAPEIYMTEDPQSPMMCPLVQQHLQQHHSHHHHIPQHPTLQHPTLQHHMVPPPQHLYPPHHRPPPRQATYPVYGVISPPPLQAHQGSPRQGHHVGAYPMDPAYPCPYMQHDGYSPDIGSPPLVQTGFVPNPYSPHSPHPRPVSPMHAQSSGGQSSRAWVASTRGGGSGGGGGFQLPSYPVYDVDKRPPKSTELYDPKNPKCTTGRKSRG